MYVLVQGTGNGGTWFTTSVYIPGDTPEAGVEDAGRAAVAAIYGHTNLPIAGMGVYRRNPEEYPALEPDMEDDRDDDSAT